MAYYVYILGNKTNSVVYIGITNDLIRRVYEHKHKLLGGFTKIYNVNILLHYEIFETAIDAITREKKLKNWHREWKDNLIKENNPTLKDLYEELL